MGLLSYVNLHHQKAQFSGLKAAKWIQSSNSIQFDPVKLDAYKLMYVDRNINGNKDGKILALNSPLGGHTLITLARKGT